MQSFMEALIATGVAISSSFDSKADIVLDDTFEKLVAWYGCELSYSCRIAAAVHDGGDVVTDCE